MSFSIRLDDNYNCNHNHNCNYNCNMPDAEGHSGTLHVAWTHLQFMNTLFDE